MATNACGPAYQIETPRLIARCMNPTDAELFKEAVDDNVDYLRPWLSWTRHEPRDLDGKIERLRQLRSNFDSGRDFVYGIFTPDESKILGVIGLQTRQGRDARELAYWIHHEFAGEGLATEASAAMVRVAFEVDGVQRVEIHCDPRNEPSAAIPKKLGFDYEATLRLRRHTAEGHRRDLMIWTLFSWNFRKGPAKDAPVKAFDAIGRQLL